MSGKYVNANELIKKCDRVINYGIANKKDGEHHISAEFVKKTIEKMETADVRENVHGKWLHQELLPNNIFGNMHGECSVCHKVRIIDNFCPNCGADMRGRKK